MSGRLKQVDKQGYILSTLLFVVHLLIVAARSPYICVYISLSFMCYSLYLRILSYNPLLTNIITLSFKYVTTSHVLVYRWSSGGCGYREEKGS